MIEGGQQCPPTFGHSISQMSRACHFNLVAKPLLALKLQILKVEPMPYSSFLLHKRSKKQPLQLSRSAISNSVKVLLPNIGDRPQTSMKLNDQKLVDITSLLLSFPVISKRTFYYMAIYQGTDTFVHICTQLSYLLEYALVNSSRIITWYSSNYITPVRISVCSPKYI